MNVDDLIEAVRDFLAVQSAIDGQVGVDFLDSYRGLICPGCVPAYRDGKARHADGCPMQRLVSVMAALEEGP